MILKQNYFSIQKYSNNTPSPCEEPKFSERLRKLRSKEGIPASIRYDRPAPSRSGSPAPSRSGSPAPSRSGSPAPSRSGSPAPNRSVNATPIRSSSAKSSPDLIVLLNKELKNKIEEKIRYLKMLYMDDEKKDLENSHNFFESYSQFFESYSQYIKINILEGQSLNQVNLILSLPVIVSLDDSIEYLLVIQKLTFNRKQYVALDNNNLKNKIYLSIESIDFGINQEESKLKSELGVSLIRNKKLNKVKTKKSEDKRGNLFQSYSASEYNFIVINFITFYLDRLLGQIKNREYLQP